MFQTQLAAGTGFQTGTICTDSNLYKCSDDILRLSNMWRPGRLSRTARLGTGKAIQCGRRSR